VTHTAGRNEDVILDRLMEGSHTLGGKNTLNNYILLGQRFFSSCVWPCVRGYGHPDVSRV